jgi:hypothetical protein
MDCLAPDELLAQMVGDAMAPIVGKVQPVYSIKVGLTGP